MRVILPMAGQGQRFVDAGYDLPKPMIDVCGQPMIERVIDNLDLDAQYYFIVKEEHVTKFDIDLILKSKIPDCKIVTVSKKTEGAACSAMLAYEKEVFDKDELIITNCDQLFEWNKNEFIDEARKFDGALLCHLDDHPKWSYCNGQKLSPSKLLVSSVVEKPKFAPIDNFANVGFYYWNKGRFFAESLELMMEKDDRVNGEFYIAPLYNYMLNDFRMRVSSGKVIASLCKKMHGLGTPEDLKEYENKLNLDNEKK